MHLNTRTVDTKVDAKVLPVSDGDTSIAITSLRCP